MDVESIPSISRSGGMKHPARLAVPTFSLEAHMVEFFKEETIVQHLQLHMICFERSFKRTHS